MMDLFKPDGHLTRDALHALGGDVLSELERLEISEHLSFCDDCLTAYLAVLDGTELLEVPAPMADKVLKAAKRKGRAVQFARYTSVAAAAALAVTLWSTGLIGGIAGAITDIGGYTPPATGTSQTAAAPGDDDEDAPRAPLGSRLDNALASVNGHLNNLFGGGNNAPTEETSEELSERAQREALFGTINETNSETGDNN